MGVKTLFLAAAAMAACGASANAQSACGSNANSNPLTEIPISIITPPDSSLDLHVNGMSMQTVTYTPYTSPPTNFNLVDVCVVSTVHYNFENYPSSDSQSATATLAGATESFTYGAPHMDPSGSPQISAILDNSGSFSESIKLTLDPTDLTSFDEVRLDNPSIYAEVSMSPGNMPEPVTWLMMVVGAGFTGVSLRRARAERRRLPDSASA